MTKEVKTIIWITVAVAAIAGVAFAPYLLFRTEETHISTTEPTVETSTLVCQAMAATEAGFFDTSGTVNAKQEIKATFIESAPDKINYLYDGVYASAEAASKANDNLHADYNIYMGVDAESLTPNFAVIDNALKINLFASQKQMNAKVGRLFFLANEEAADFANYKDEDLLKIYQDKGFSCELETNNN